MAPWILYGANGYTGELIAREANRRGLQPILAGRNQEQMSKLAAEFGCQSRVFSLSNTADITSHLAGVRLLLNCAGPFSATAVPLMEACLRVGVHYLDITGEIDVIQAAANRNGLAKQAGIALIPAVGFDVVPSDCLAAMLAAKLPGATRLLLAFTGSGGMSPGTAKTAIESLPQGGRVRIKGRITCVPLAWKTREVKFAKRTKTVVTIPWGDVASAYYSTGIENIEVYTTMRPEQLRLMRRWGWLAPLLNWTPLRRYFERRAASTVRGPTAKERAAGGASLWGRVEIDAGRFVEGTLTTPNGYNLTALTAMAAIERVLAGDVPPGFHTPSLAFGRDFILSIPGTEFRIAVESLA